MDVQRLGINLIRLYFKPRDIQDSGDLKEAVLSACMTFRKWGVMANEVILVLTGARVLFSVSPIKKEPDVLVLYLPNEIEDNTNPDAYGFTFWTTKKSLKKIREKILE